MLPLLRKFKVRTKIAVTVLAMSPPQPVDWDDRGKPIVTEIITKKHEIPVIAHGKILDDDGNVIGTF